MTRTTPLPNHTRLGIVWRDGLRQFRSLLDRLPDYRTWHVQIRVKILTYLVDRYADDPISDSPPVRGPASTPTFRVPAGTEGARRPRSPAAIREILDRISEENQLTPK